MLKFNKKERVSILTLAAWMIAMFAIIGYLTFIAFGWIVNGSPE